MQAHGGPVQGTALHHESGAYFGRVKGALQLLINCHG